MLHCGQISMISSCSPLISFRLGESCSHVAALLFKVEAAVRLGYTKVACTDQACTWNACFVKDVKPATIAQTPFFREEARKAVESGSATKRRKTAIMDPLPPEAQQQFLQLLLTTKTLPVVLHCFDQTSGNFPRDKPVPIVQLPQPLRNFFNPKNLELSPGDFAAKVSSLQAELVVSEEQCRYIYDVTKDQSECLTWYQQRAGRITASTAHRILRTNQQTPAPSLIKSVCSDSNAPVHAAPLQYGRQQEKTVLAELAKYIPAHHDGARLERTGLRVKNDQPWLAASADGIFTCTCHGTCVVEVKCPWTFRMSTLSEMVHDAKSCLNRDRTLKPNHPHHTQIQLQMYMHDAPYGLFAVKVKDELSVSVVPRDNALLTQVIPTLQTFWEQHITTELLTRRLENHQEPPPQSPLQRLYCYCQQPCDENDDDPGAVLVGCDGAACPFEWVHLRCIRPKRKTIPKGNWYCKNCKKSKTKKK